MPLIDYALYALLLAVAVMWWMRSHVLLIALVLLVFTGVAAVLDYRWQAFVALGVAVLLLCLRLLMPKPSGVPAYSGVLATVLCAFSAAMLYWFPAPALPEPGGPHAVGVRGFVLVDHERTGVLADPADVPRRLLVKTWYPAAPGAGAERAPYFSDAEAGTTATGLGRLIGVPFLFQYAKHVMTNSYVNAPLVEDVSRGLPVIVYSHGYTAFAGQNTALMEELASHGYLVFAVHHSYDSSPPVFPDGTVLDEDPELLESLRSDLQGEATEAMLAAFTGDSHDVRRAARVVMHEEAQARGERISTASTTIWLEDRAFVLDALASGAVPAEVADVVAAGRYEATGQMGMSFGGSTSGAFCLEDVRCAAAVNLDGGDYHFSPFNRSMPVPFMMMYSDYQRTGERLAGEAVEVHAFNDYSYERHEFAGLRDDVHRFVVSDVEHLGYSDFNYFLRNPVRGALVGPIEGRKMLAIQNIFVRGFFDRYIRGRNDAFPMAELAAFEGMVRSEPIDDLRLWWLDTHPEDRAELVRFDTSVGAIEVAVYPERAPVSATNFLRYVDEGRYDGATLYRASRRSDGAAIEVIQGGLLEATMTGGAADANYANAEPPLGRIAHETTHTTGIANEAGTLAYARLAPGTAGSEFFFNVADNPVLDTDAGTPERDGFGYATFGRVLRGLDVLRRVQQMPTDRDTEIEVVRGQLLDEPVMIERVYRMEIDR